jgi:DNA polymerase (family 10)
MTNSDIARVFTSIATGLELDGGNPFRIRAYHEAARVVESHPEPMASLAATEGRLEAIRGIGKDLAQKIKDIVRTGSTELLDEIFAKYPREVLALTEIPGLGPKRVKVLFDSLGVRNRDDLERAARAGKVRALPKFGETVEQNVLKALAATSAAPDAPRLLLAGAWDTAHVLAEHVRRVKDVQQVELAGSFRRRRETVGDLDLVVSGGDGEQVMDTFASHPYVMDVIARGPTKCSVRIASGLQVDLRLVAAESFGAALVYFTGSKAHNIALRKLAIDKGWSLNEYGLTAGDRVVAGRTEADVYRALGLAWIPPEMREALGEIELAAANALPRLVENGDLRADLHMHTNRSDGVEPLAAMVRAARDRGYEYVAITDHSQALGMTNGFDAARVRQSVDEMKAVRREVPGIEVLHGLECDILADGTLDLDDESLALLDWVIVSLHSQLAQPEAVATARVLRAINHPAVHAMGHPTGRKIGAREPARFDMEKVFVRAAELGVAMEINGQPDRLDLSDVHARLAREKGVQFVLDTDAHGIPGLDYIDYAVFNARRAWLTKEHVLNALPFAKFEAWRKARRAGAAPRAPRRKRRAP